MASLARHATGGLAAPQLSIPRPGLRGLGIGAAVAFLVLLVDALLNEQTRFDVWGITQIQRLDLPGWATLSHYVGELTSSEGAVAAWALAILLFVGLRWWIAAAAFFALPIGGIVNLGVGELVERTRPHLAELERSSKNFEERSFPSGHVEGAVLFYGLLFVVARRIANPILRWMVQGGSLAVLATVGLSRVWTGAHWPTDVLAAYALGGMLLAPLAWLYLKLDASLGRLPLIKAAAQPHDERVPHAHALTSLVLFEGERVVKVYNPGLLPRVIYWFAFQAPFPYVGNRAALRAAVARRNLAALLTKGWYGSERVARAEGIAVRDGRLALASAFIEGDEPTDRAAARAFLNDLRLRFEAAGLPTWQIDPRQPRAIDNILETPEGEFVVVDLESGLVSPMASLTTWKRAIRRGLVPFYDEVFFDVTRDYVAREEASLRAVLGAAGFAELLTTLDEAEREAAAWHRSELRLWSKLLRWSWIAVDVRGWPRRSRALLAGGQEKGTAWMEKAVGTWEAEGRITAAEGVTLREQIAAPTFQAMLPYLGAHIAVSIPLRFPFGSIARTLMVIGALGYETSRLLRRRIDRHQWKQAFSIHSPLVAILAAIPGFGSFAYLAAKPVRANRLLLRTVFDAALLKAPWDLYERSKLRGLIARPLGAAIEAPGESPAAPTAVAPAPIVLATNPASEAPVANWGTLSVAQPATSRPNKRAETRPANRPKPIFDQARPVVTPAWMPLSGMAAASAVHPEEMTTPRAA
jgi:undecaprenyl-diphosphatase